MNIHEYQAKEILAGFGVKIAEGGIAYSVEEAAQRAREIEGNVWVVKAQIHSGARGKAGGIKVCKTHNEVEAAAEDLLGKTLVTHQSGPAGKLCSRVYIEAGTKIAKEIYLSFLIDRSTERVIMVGSAQGGMEIETLAKEHPEAIVKIYIEPAVGLQDFQARKMAFASLTRSTFRSMPMARRPCRIASQIVVPAPRNGSTITSPGLENRLINWPGT